jgi:hypothetical protein
MAKLARDNRQFLTQAVTLVAGQGIRQFLDVGSGLPTGGNTHQAAQAVDQSCRVVYADNDPVVLTQARALLTDPGVGVIEGDLRDPLGILGDPVVCKVIRPDEPVRGHDEPGPHRAPARRRPWDVWRVVFPCCGRPPIGR